MGNWGHDKLENLCILNPKKSEVKHLEDKTIVSFLPMRDLVEDQIDFKPKEFKTIAEVYQGYTYFRDSDVILAKVTPCFENGKAGIAKGLSNGVGFGSSEFHILRPKDQVLPEWIYYFLKQKKIMESGQISMTGSAGLKRVPPIFLRSLNIPLPPLPEQKRIVSKLDALFERIDQSIALLEENLKHTQAMMSSVLDEFYKEGDTPLSAVVELNPKKSQVRGLDEELEVTFLPMAELNEFQISFEKKQAKPLKEVYKGYTYFQDDDVLLAKVTPCFENQKGGLATGLTNGIGFGSSEYHVLRPSEKVIPEWIYYAIMSREFNNEGKRSMTGAVGLKRVPSSFVENWKIPIPSIEDQKKSIRRIQAIFDKSKESIIQFDQKLNNLKALKSSLLDKAFKGEL